MGISQTIRAKKFEENWTKIKGSCQSERVAAEMISYSKMPLANKLLFLKEIVLEMIWAWIKNILEGNQS